MTSKSSIIWYRSRALFISWTAGYVDFERLARLDDAGSVFVTRAKSNIKAKRRYSRTVDRSTGLICDQTIVLTGFYTRQGFDRPLRRVKFNDPETGKTLVFLTNNFALPAMTIAKLYKYRWQVELFFKWIKQHLRIKSFLGEFENAVKAQIWSAICVYVLIAIVKKRLRIKASLYEILQILSLTLFEKTELLCLFQNAPLQNLPQRPSNQLNSIRLTLGHLNLDLPNHGRLPDFPDRRHGREPGADAVLASHGFCAVDEF